MTNTTDNPDNILAQRSLGTTGILVSLLGLGLVKIGRNSDVKYSAAFDLPSEDSVHNLLSEAERLGVTLLDTAPAYGTSEARLGKALQQLPEFAKRCVISTKVGENWDQTGSTFDFTAGAIERSVERSLRRLQRDYLDIVLVHSSGADVELLSSHKPLDTLQKLQQQGLVRACGFSGKTLEGGRMALQEGAQVLMVTYNPGETDQLPLLAEAGTRGAGVLIKKTISERLRGPGDAGDNRRAGWGIVDCQWDAQRRTSAGQRRNSECSGPRAARVSRVPSELQQTHVTQAPPAPAAHISRRSFSTILVVDTPSTRDSTATSPP